MDVPIIPCPTCGRDVQDITIIKDGGSRECTHCGTLFHRNKRGDYHTKDVPMFCLLCKQPKMNGRRTEKIQCPKCRVKKSELSYFKSNDKFTCSLCHHSFEYR